MRKTRLVILPGARCLNQLGCLLLFLACPMIAFKGQENREVEPYCKLLTLRQRWLSDDQGLEGSNVCEKQESGFKWEQNNAYWKTGYNQTDSPKDFRLSNKKEQVRLAVKQPTISRLSERIIREDRRSVRSLERSTHASRDSTAGRKDIRHETRAQYVRNIDRRDRAEPLFDRSNRRNDEREVRKMREILIASSRRAENRYLREGRRSLDSRATQREALFENRNDDRATRENRLSSESLRDSRLHRERISTNEIERNRQNALFRSSSQQRGRETAANRRSVEKTTSEESSRRSTRYQDSRLEIKLESNRETERDNTRRNIQDARKETRREIARERKSVPQKEATATRNHRLSRRDVQSIRENRAISLDNRRPGLEGSRQERSVRLLEILMGENFRKIIQKRSVDRLDRVTPATLKDTSRFDRENRMISLNSREMMQNRQREDNKREATRRSLERDSPISAEERRLSRERRLVRTNSISREERRMVRSSSLSREERRLVRSSPISREERREVRSNPTTQEERQIARSTPISREERREVRSNPTTQEERQIARSTPISREERRMVRSTPISREERREVRSSSLSREERREVRSSPISREERRMVRSSSLSREERREVRSTPISREERREVRSNPTTQEERQIARSSSISREERRMVRSSSLSREERREVRTTPISREERREVRSTPLSREERREVRSSVISREDRRMVRSNSIPQEERRMVRLNLASREERRLARSSPVSREERRMVRSIDSGASRKSERTQVTENIERGNRQTRDSRNNQEDNKEQRRSASLERHVRGLTEDRLVENQRKYEIRVRSTNTRGREESRNEAGYQRSSRSLSAERSDRQTLQRKETQVERQAFLQRVHRDKQVDELATRRDRRSDRRVRSLDREIREDRISSGNRQTNRRENVILDRRIGSQEIARQNQQTETRVRLNNRLTMESELELASKRDTSLRRTDRITRNSRLELSPAVSRTMSLERVKREVRITQRQSDLARRNVRDIQPTRNNIEVRRSNREDRIVGDSRLSSKMVSLERTSNTRTETIMEIRSRESPENGVRASLLSRNARESTNEHYSARRQEESRRQMNGAPKVRHDSRRESRLENREFRGVGESLSRLDRRERETMRSNRFERTVRNVPEADAQFSRIENRIRDERRVDVNRAIASERVNRETRLDGRRERQQSVVYRAPEQRTRSFDRASAVVRDVRKRDIQSVRDFRLTTRDDRSDSRRQTVAIERANERRMDQVQIRAIRTARAESRRNLNVERLNSKVEILQRARESIRISNNIRDNRMNIREISKERISPMIQFNQEKSLERNNGGMDVEIDQIPEIRKYGFMNFIPSICDNVASGLDTLNKRLWNYSMNVPGTEHTNGLISGGIMAVTLFLSANKRVVF